MAQKLKNNREKWRLYKKQTGIDIYSLIMKGRGEYIDEK